MLGILFYRKLMQNSGIAEFGNRVKQGIYSILKKNVLVITILNNSGLVTAFGGRIYAVSP